MKALSLWQPWGSAVAIGAKRIETRSWSTRYRGPLAIHASKRPLTKQERFDFTFDGSWRAVFGILTPAHQSDPLWENLPYGAIIATCELVDCRPTERFCRDALHERHFRSGPRSSWFSWSEYEMGDYSPGRFGWVLENVRALPEALPCRGRQGLFNVEL